MGEAGGIQQVCGKKTWALLRMIDAKARTCINRVAAVPSREEASKGTQHTAQTPTHRG